LPRLLGKTIDPEDLGPVREADAMKRGKRNQHPIPRGTIHLETGNWEDENPVRNLHLLRRTQPSKMKNTRSLTSAVKAVLAVVLFSLGFARAAAHVDPASHVQISDNKELGLPSAPCIAPPK
jgi:hypothetical protein